MRRLLPDPAERTLEELYGDLEFPSTSDRDPSRGHLALGMVSSVDGAVSVEGTSGGLGHEADGVAFRRLRDASDAILVGAGTVRAERYRPPDPGPERRARRSERGLAPVPRLVIVSSSLRFDLDEPVFSDPRLRPIIVTHRGAEAAAVARLQPVADVARIGDERVDLAEVLRDLRRGGLGRVLCEGGARLAGELLAADLIDEIFLTLAPSVVGGEGGRILVSEQERPRGLRLVELNEHAGELLLRYRRMGS